MLTLRTLGELQLLSAEGAVPIARVREMAFLTYVACNGDRTLTRAHLASSFWPRSSEQHALHSLSQAMYRLTKRAEGLAFRGDARAIAVDPGSVAVDLLEFRNYLQRREFDRARALYRGPFLDGFTLDDAPEFEIWLEQTRREVSLAAEDMFRGLLAASETTGDWKLAEEAASGLLEFDPYDESAAATVIGILAARGDRARAAERWTQVRSALHSIGRRPSRRLENAARAIDAAPAEPPEVAADHHLPLIGRRAEFDSLKARLARAQAANGSGILVAGKAGIGKTRLCQQVVRLAALRGFRVLTAAGAPLLQGTPYAAARDLLGGFSGKDLARLTPAWIDVLAGILPAARSEAAIPAADPPARDWIFAAVTAVVDACARETPVLLVVEDLQWVDAGTADLLRYLARRIHETAVVIVATARASEVEGESAQALLHSLDRLDLRELNPEGIREFIAAFCARVGTRMANAEAERLGKGCAGHPFFLLELLRRWNRAWGTGAASELAASGDSIEAFLGARLASVSAPAQLVAEVVAVLGGDTDSETVDRVAGLDSLTTASAIDELTAAGLLRDGARVEFVHDLAREAAYGQLAPNRRRSLHARAARALRLTGSVDACTLAVHSHLGGAHDLAFRYALIAARTTERRIGFPEAEGYWRLAAEHACTKRSRTNATWGLANCLFRCKANSEADELFAELLQGGVLAPEKELIARARRLTICTRLSRLAGQEEACLELVERAEALGRRTSALAVAEAVGFAAAGTGGQALLGAMLPFMCRVSEESPDTPDKLPCVLMTIHLLAFCGERKRADEYLELAARLAADTSGTRRADVRALCAMVLLLRGCCVAAEREFTAALGGLGGDPRRLPPGVRANWAVLETELGRFAEASGHLEATLQWARETGGTYDICRSEPNLAVIEYERRNWREAERHCRLALEGLDLDTVPGRGLEARGILGLISLETCEARAQEYRQELLRDSDVVTLGVDVSYAETFLARMDERDGRVDVALQRLERALRAYATRDFFVHARLELEKARLIGLTDREGGLALAREVRARALDAGAVLLLNQSEALIRQLKRGATSISSARCTPGSHGRADAAARKG